jgi:hypothetical protein
MTKTIFKVLMHGGHYVDTGKLGTGIYASVKPCLYDVSETIENLINNANRRAEEEYMNEGYAQRYAKNIANCQLVEVSLLISGLNAQASVASKADSSHPMTP